MRQSRYRFVSSMAILMMCVMLPTQMGGCPAVTGTVPAEDAVSDSDSAPTVVDVTATEAYDLIQANQDNADFIILDVRTASEYAGGHIEGATNLCSTCTAAFMAGLATLDSSATYLVYCGSGRRSANAVQIMTNAGFIDLYNLVGGLQQWIATGYETVISD